MLREALMPAKGSGEKEIMKDIRLAKMTGGTRQYGGRLLYK
jgi:hypothetical protein